MIKSGQKIKMINIKDILPNPYQLRRNFNQKELLFLCRSIKNSGMISPVVLRPSLNGYEIICGQRRIIAARMANMESVPAIIIRANDSKCAVMSIEENLCRANLTKYEEAEGFFNLLSYHNIKKDKITNGFFENGAQLARKLQLLRFSEKERYKIEEYKINEDMLSDILKLHDEESRIKVIETIKEQELTKKETAELVRQIQRELSEEGKERKKYEKRKGANTLLYKNTVKNTINLLKRNGARTETDENENEKYIEYRIKVYK